MTKPSGPPSACKHPRVRGPDALGEHGAYCIACRANVPCPHPPNERETADFLAGERSVTVCNWCGEEI